MEDRGATEFWALHEIGWSRTRALRFVYPSIPSTGVAYGTGVTLCRAVRWPALCCTAVRVGVESAMNVFTPQRRERE